MTEYYTTQSLATAAAAIEQGFEDGQTSTSYQDGGFHEGVDLDIGEEWRFPKTPHNEALMEVMVDDTVEDPMGYGHVTIHEVYGISSAFCRQENCKIIYRNNKPFPVWDKEGV